MGKTVRTTALNDFKLNPTDWLYYIVPIFHDFVNQFVPNDLIPLFLFTAE